MAVGDGDCDLISSAATAGATVTAAAAGDLLGGGVDVGRFVPAAVAGGNDVVGGRVSTGNVGALVNLTAGAFVGNGDGFVRKLPRALVLALFDLAEIAKTVTSVPMRTTTAKPRNIKNRRRVGA